AITAAVRVLTASSAGGSPEAKQREIIERQTRRLSALVDDLLDVSRVVSGKILLERRPLDLGELARRCVESYEGAAGRRREGVGSASGWRWSGASSSSTGATSLPTAQGPTREASSSCSSPPCARPASPCCPCTNATEPPHRHIRATC